MDIYFFDTSALLNDVDLFNKTYGIMLIHNIVLDELDKKADKGGIVGKNARCIIDKLFQYSKMGNIHKGIELGHNTFLKIIDTKPKDEYIDYGLNNNRNDNLILSIYKEICETHKDDDVYLYSGDKLMCVKADVGIVKYIGKGNISENKKKKQNYRNQRNFNNVHH